MDLKRRAFLFGAIGTVFGVTASINEAEARGTATFTVPKGKKTARLTWVDKNGAVKYSTNLDVQPGQKFRIVTR